jgi:hypothetical protein
VSSGGGSCQMLPSLLLALEFAGGLALPRPRRASMPGGRRCAKRMRHCSADTRLATRSMSLSCHGESAAGRRGREPSTWTL